MKNTKKIHEKIFFLSKKKGFLQSFIQISVTLGNQSTFWPLDDR